MKSVSQFLGFLLLTVVAANNDTDTDASPPALPPPLPPPDSNTTGLSGGAIAGIIAGVVVGLGALGALAYFLVFREGAQYGSVVYGISAATGNRASTARKLGENNLPMMAMRVNDDDNL